MSELSEFEKYKHFIIHSNEFQSYAYYLDEFAFFLLGFLDNDGMKVECKQGLN